MAGLNQFCFSTGETSHAEGGKGEAGHRPKAPDNVGVRRPETLPLRLPEASVLTIEPADRPFRVDWTIRVDRWAGPVWPNSGGLWLGRATSTAFAKSLDLDPNLFRQNGPIQPRKAL